MAGGYTLNSGGVDVHDASEQAKRVGFGALEAVAPDDASKSPAVPNGLGLFDNCLLGVEGAAAEDRDPASVEGALDDVGDALGEGADRNPLRIKHLFRLRLLDMRGGKFHLDDMR